jgi:hypothetical protein
VLKLTAVSFKKFAEVRFAFVRSSNSKTFREKEERVV